MNRSRLKQDAVIVMAILVVILALWKLRTHPQYFGGMGSWAETNLFGASTLNLMFEGAGRNGDAQPIGPIAPVSGVSTQAIAVETNLTGSQAPRSANAPPTTNNAPATETISTNLHNTNGPISMNPEFFDTPQAVSASPNLPEAAAFSRRLGDAGAKGGDIQISLMWNNLNDLDLHCVDPFGTEINYQNKHSAASGGTLDVDANYLSSNCTEKPVENIYWPTGGAPAGDYKISVVYFKQQCEADMTKFSVRVVVQGKATIYPWYVRYTGLKEPHEICTLHYDPANPDPERRGIITTPSHAR